MHTKQSSPAGEATPVKMTARKPMTDLEKTWYRLHLEGLHGFKRPAFVQASEWNKRVSKDWDEDTAASNFARERLTKEKLAALAEVHQQIVC